jgi:hypothetical protein
MLIRCSEKSIYSLLRRDVETCRIRATTSTQLPLMCWYRNWCKSKHAQTCLYYEQVAWLPLRRIIKSFRELHRHTMYIEFLYMTLRLHIRFSFTVKYDTGFLTFSNKMHLVCNQYTFNIRRHLLVQAYNMSIQHWVYILHPYRKLLPTASTLEVAPCLIIRPWR